MANLGQLVVNLEANIARFTQDMGRASQVTEQAMNRMQGAADKVNNVLNLIGVGLSVDLLVGEVNRTLDSLAALDDMAQKTGSSVETLSKLSKVASFTGTDLGSVDGMLVKLSKNLNDVDEKSNKTAKALAAIGISTQDLKDQDAAQVFVQVARKLQDYEDGAGKVALVTDLMGKSAADMLPYLNDVAESIDDFAAESTEAAANAAKLQDDIGRLRVKYDEMATAIVTAAVPAATDFIEALMDTKREANSLTNDTSVNTWADDVAIGLATVVDFAMLTAKTLSVVGSSIKAVSADIQVAATLQPAVMAYELSQGRNPLDNFRATMAERDKVVEQANVKLEALLTAPLNVLENNVRARIKDRQGLAGINAEIDGPLGGGWSTSTRTDLKYSSSDGKREKPEAEKVVEQTEKLIANLTKQRDTYGMTGAAVLEYQLAQENIPRALADKAVAVQKDIDRMDAAAKAQKDAADAQQKAAEKAAQAQIKNRAEVEQIRQSLMTDVEFEQTMHDTRLEQLRVFHDARLENVTLANALIEAEEQRHSQAQRDMQLSSAQNLLSIAQSSADQLYGALKTAGMEQTALGKAMFIAQKAIQIASIIVNTEVAAAAAQAGMIAAAGATAAVSGPAGPAILAAGIAAGAAYATATRVMGYATAGIVAGTAIASAEGGYDIPAGVNPVTQLHEKEMVLPKAQAEVIRGLAANGGAGGGMKITIVNQTTGRIDNVIEQRISPTERALIIQEAVAATASTLGDPNSKTSRSMARNFNVARTRS